MLYKITFELITEASAEHSDYAQHGFVTIDGDEVPMTEDNHLDMHKDPQGVYLHNLTGKGDIDLDLDLEEGDIALFDSRLAATVVPTGYLYNLADIRNFIAILHENPGDYEPYDSSTRGFRFVQNINPWEADETLPDTDENGDAIESPVLCRTLTYFMDERDGLTEEEFKLVSECIRKSRTETNAAFSALLRSKRIAILKAQLAEARDVHTADDAEEREAKKLYQEARIQAQASLRAVKAIQRQLDAAMLDT